MKRIPSELVYLLAPETRAFAYLATTMDDGSPQVTPVWFEADDEHIIINTAKGRVKDRNIRIRPKVALVIPDPKNTYRYVQIRGRVDAILEEGAAEQFDSVAVAYTGECFSYPSDNYRLERAHIS